MKNGYISTIIFFVLLTNLISCNCAVLFFDDFGSASRDEFLPEISDPSDEILTAIYNISFEDIKKNTLTARFFKNVADVFCWARYMYVLKGGKWLDGKNPFLSDISIYSQNRHNFYKNMLNYAQKTFIENGTKVIAITDIHADLQSLDRLIDSMIEKGYMDANLKLQPYCFFVGLGDYMDRGDQPLNVLARLMLIVLKNPLKAVLLRGNHECLVMNRLKEYNIDAKIRESFGNEFDITQIHALLTKVYESMPLALYFSEPYTTDEINDFLIFSHGLLDFKFNPAEFLDFDNEKLRQKAKLRKRSGSRLCIINKNIDLDRRDIYIYDSPLEGHGFMWHDIEISGFASDVPDDAGRLKYSPEYIAKFCRKFCSKKSKISGMVGGHDHYFAKAIEGKGRNEFGPSAGYVLVDDYNPGERLNGVFKVPKPEISAFYNYFSLVKFVSSPVSGIAYNPTYLVVSRNENIWDYEAVEG